MKKLFFSFAVFAFASGAFADDLAAKATEIIGQKDQLPTTFGADGADKIIHRLESYLGAYNNHNCASNPDDILCGHIAGELELYIHIVENSDTAALEKAH